MAECLIRRAVPIRSGIRSMNARRAAWTERHQGETPASADAGVGGDEPRRHDHARAVQHHDPSPRPVLLLPLPQYVLSSGHTAPQKGIFEFEMHLMSKLAHRSRPDLGRMLRARQSSRSGTSGIFRPCSARKPGGHRILLVETSSRCEYQGKSPDLRPQSTRRLPVLPHPPGSPAHSMSSSVRNAFV